MAQLGQEARAPVSGLWLILLRKFLVRVRFATGGEEIFPKQLFLFLMQIYYYYYFILVRILLVV